MNKNIAGGMDAMGGYLHYYVYIARNDR